MNVNTGFLRICPACGYSFRTIDPKNKKKVKFCPACGHKFMEPTLNPQETDKFDKRII